MKKLLILTLVSSCLFGDLAKAAQVLPSTNSAENSNTLIAEKITEKILMAGKFPLILGGEHSITAGSIRPFVKKYPDLAILHFDAHADLRDGFDGEHYSHAAALRRVMDNPIST